MDEIALPLVSLGLSTDTEFVTKLLQSLIDNNPEKKDQEIQITLKDFVKIFNVDKIGERISKAVKDACTENRI